MKVRSMFLGSLFAVLSILFISSPSASAGECSVEDPCQTYAVMNGDTVANIIVCQPSVCGSGIFDGKRVVPQVAAGSQGENRGGYWGTESNGVFTVERSQSTNTTTQTINDVNVTVTMNGTIKDTSTFENTVNKSLEEWFNPVQLPINTSITISANEETLSFNERKTKDFFSDFIWFSDFELLFANLNFFNFNLFSWGWFI